MFESMQATQADAILGLIAEHKNDPRAEKIDLGVGVYRTEQGETPVLNVVKRAERILLDTQDTKSYIGTAGAADFNAAMQVLTFGDSSLDDRLVTIQAPGGSGSLRVAAGMILRAAPNASVWASEPTWANHVPLLGGAGLNLKPYPYYDTERMSLTWTACWPRCAPRRRATSFCYTPAVITPQGSIRRRTTGGRLQR